MRFRDLCRSFLLNPASKLISNFTNVFDNVFKDFNTELYLSRLKMANQYTSPLNVDWRKVLNPMLLYIAYTVYKILTNRKT